MIDLNRSDAPVETRCSICIVGAGAAGIYLANQLARRRVDVILLDAGGQQCESGERVGIEAQFDRDTYGGAAQGRAFGWGGTTSRWGGLLVPHSELDLPRGDTQDGRTWSHIVQVVRRNQQSVYRTLRLRGSTLFQVRPSHRSSALAALDREGIETRTCDFLPFWRRRLTYLATAEMRDVTVYLNAVAHEWVLAGGRNGMRVVGVKARSASGKSLRVSAEQFVIAAGAIESARILLEINRCSGDALLPCSAAVGQYLSDHLSAPVANVHADDQASAAKLFGPVFRSGRMRSFRFIDRETAASRARHFAHLIFDISIPAFAAAKAMLYGIQSAVPVKWNARQLAAAAGGGLNMVYHYLAKRRLLVPRNTPCHLQLDMEQPARRENRISLGAEKDRYGRPIAVVSWSISDSDTNELTHVATGLREKWNRAPGLPRLVQIAPELASAKPYDAYHPVGTCRMGCDPEATVDFSLRVKGSENLFVLSTATLPTAGTANPTFTMLCLGHALAETLRQTLTAG